MTITELIAEVRDHSVRECKCGLCEPAQRLCDWAEAQIVKVEKTDEAQEDVG